MLMVTQLVGFGVGENVLFPSVEEFTEQSNGASQNSYTFSSVTLTLAGLLVVRFLVGGTFNATRVASAVTVGGNAATIVQQNSGFVTLGSAAAGLAAISLPAGASGDIVTTIAGGLNAASVAIHPLAIMDLISTTPHHNNGNGVGAATSISTTLNIPSGGVQVVSAASADGSSSHIATGYTPAVAAGTVIDTSWRFQPGYDVRMSAETGRTLTSAGTLSQRRAIAAASWR